MDNWQPSNLSWSFARKTHFESCRRHYFYHRFWGQDPKLRWRLFEMRNITILTMLRGQVVHTVIAGALRSIRLGLEVDLDMLRSNVTEVIRARYMESAKRLWHIDNRPPDRKLSEITNLLEHYYHFPNLNERARDAREIAWQCIGNLYSSDIWHEIATSESDNWKEIDEDSFPSFDLDGIQVYANIDFAYSNAFPTIVDWKTGALTEQDRKQLILYSLYANAKWNWNPLETSLKAVYLQPEFKIDAFTPTEDEIESVKEEVKRSFNEMLEYEPAFGPADIENFPKTEDTANCAWCRFQGICRA